MKKLKLKGAYWWPSKVEDYWGSSGSNWNKDFSMMVVPKCAVECMVNNQNPEQLILLFPNPFDFMLRYKTPHGAKLYIGEKEMLRTVRYYVSKAGEPMKKIAAPKGEVGTFKKKNSLKEGYFEEILAQIPKGKWDERIHTKNKSIYEAVTTSVESGRLVKCCNHVRDFNWADVDFDYYVSEVKKLMIGA